MFEMMLGVLRTGKPRSPQGQAYFTTVGWHDWICPSGVFSVSCVLVGPGGDSTNVGSTYTGGDGGALRYRNNIPVIPGKNYRVYIGPSGSGSATNFQDFGMYAGNGTIATPLTDEIFGFSGGKGSTPPPSTATRGGDAAGYTADGMQSTGPNYNGAGTDGYGRTKISNGQYGGGGGVWLQSGTAGCARIIWGDDRAFPDKGLEDVM